MTSSRVFHALCRDDSPEFPEKPYLTKTTMMELYDAEDLVLCLISLVTAPAFGRRTDGQICRDYVELCIII